MLCADIDGLKVSLSQKWLTCGHRAELVAYDVMPLTVSYAMTRSGDRADPFEPELDAPGAAVAGRGDSRLWYFVET
jgi:hypothetical protein